MTAIVDQDDGLIGDGITSEDLYRRQKPPDPITVVAVSVLSRPRFYGQSMQSMESIRRSRLSTGQSKVFIGHSSWSPVDNRWSPPCPLDSLRCPQDNRVHWTVQYVHPTVHGVLWTVHGVHGANRTSTVSTGQSKESATRY